MSKLLRKSDACENCGYNTNFQSPCVNCGLIISEFEETTYRWKSTHNPSKHFESVLYRIQGMHSPRCNRFDSQYMNNLKQKIGGDYSLQNIHKHLPNRDQRYLNYIHCELTDSGLFIDYLDREFLKTWFNICYQEYQRSDFLSRKRPCALNILEVVVDRFPRLAYIKPFIYTKFKLNQDIYNRLKHVSVT